MILQDDAMHASAAKNRDPLPQHMPAQNQGTIAAKVKKDPKLLSDSQISRHLLILNPHSSTQG